MTDPSIPTFIPTSVSSWRDWLQENHESENSVWVVYYKKDTGVPSLSWEEAVEEALCFGWIDSRRQPIDSEKFRQYFCKRKPNGNWSKINKEKVELLIQQGRMSPAGMQSIEVSKQNGSWTYLDDVENLTVPEDLIASFQNHPGSEESFNAFSKSSKKLALYWIHSAKREETRAKRIHEICESAAEGLLPKPIRPPKRKT